MTDALLLLATMIGVGAAAFLVARSPIFWIGLIRIVLSQLIPNIKNMIKPKNLSKDQLDKIARGQDPFRKRPKGE
jgi:hypothetical protein